MIAQQREIKRQLTKNIQGMAAANSVSARSCVMRNPITANAIDVAHVLNKKCGHFGHCVSSVVWIGITICVVLDNGAFEAVRVPRPREERSRLRRFVGNLLGVHLAELLSS